MTASDSPRRLDEVTADLPPEAVRGILAALHHGGMKASPAPVVPSRGASNPFGPWTKHRARLAALHRGDARNQGLEQETRHLLKASRLADRIIQERDDLTAEQRTLLAELLTE